MVLSWEREISILEEAHECQCNEVRAHYDLPLVKGDENCETEPCYQSCPWRKHNTATTKEMELAGGLSE